MIIIMLAVTTADSPSTPLSRPSKGVAANYSRSARSKIPGSSGFLDVQTTEIDRGQRGNRRESCSQHEGYLKGWVSDPKKYCVSGGNCCSIFKPFFSYDDEEEASLQRLLNKRKKIIAGSW